MAVKYDAARSMGEGEMNQRLKEGRNYDMVPVTLLKTDSGWRRKMGESRTVAWMERFMTSGRVGVTMVVG